MCQAALPLCHRRLHRLGSRTTVRGSLSKRVFELAILGGLGLLLLVGCERVRRASQCERLADSVNTTMKAVADETKSITPTTLRAGARHYASLSQTLGPMQFSDRQMALEVESFRRSLDSAALLTDQLADDLTRNQLGRTAVHKRDLEALRGPMKTQAYKMNAWCKHD